jgi:hypothetical protein
MGLVATYEQARPTLQLSPLVEQSEHAHPSLRSHTRSPSHGPIGAVSHRPCELRTSPAGHCHSERVLNPPTQEE